MTPGAPLADHDRQARLLALESTITASVLERWAAAAESLQPWQRFAILCGHPRSGTTLLENVFASHPGVCTLEEKDTFGDLTLEFLVNDAGRDRMAALKDSELEPYRAAYWNRVRRFGAEVEGKVFVDKYPLSSIKLPMAAKLFPAPGGDPVGWPAASPSATP